MTVLGENGGRHLEERADLDLMQKMIPFWSLWLVSMRRTASDAGAERQAVAIKSWRCEVQACQGLIPISRDSSVFSSSLKHVMVQIDHFAPVVSKIFTEADAMENNIKLQKLNGTAEFCMIANLGFPMPIHAL